MYVLTSGVRFGESLAEDVHVCGQLTDEYLVQGGAPEALLFKGKDDVTLLRTMFGCLCRRNGFLGSLMRAASIVKEVNTQRTLCSPVE